MIQAKQHYLALLDRALLFAARHTGADGRMSVNGEIHSCVDEYKVKTILADLRASAANEGEES